MQRFLHGEEKTNKSLGFSKAHPSGDGDRDPGFCAGLVLADRRRDGRWNNKKGHRVGSFPFTIRPPVILALWPGYTLRNFTVCIVLFTGYSEGKKKTIKQLENQIFI